MPESLSLAQKLGFSLHGSKPAGLHRAFFSDRGSHEMQTKEKYSSLNPENVCPIAHGPPQRTILANERNYSTTSSLKRNSNDELLYEIMENLLRKALLHRIKRKGSTSRRVKIFVTSYRVKRGITLLKATVLVRHWQEVSSDCCRLRIFMPGYPMPTTGPHPLLPQARIHRVPSRNQGRRSLQHIETEISILKTLLAKA